MCYNRTSSVIVFPFAVCVAVIARQSPPLVFAPQSQGLDIVRVIAEKSNDTPLSRYPEIASAGEQSQHRPSWITVSPGSTVFSWRCDGLWWFMCLQTHLELKEVDARSTTCLQTATVPQYGNINASRITKSMPWVTCVGPPIHHGEPEKLG